MRGAGQVLLDPIIGASRRVRVGIAGPAGLARLGKVLRYGARPVFPASVVEHLAEPKAGGLTWQG